MNRVRLAAPVLLLIVLLLPLSGCTTALKQAYYEVRGAQSDILLITELREDALAPYRRLVLEPTTTTVGDRICPPRALRLYDEHLADAVQDLRSVYPGGEPGLRINSEIVYTQKKGLLSGALALVRVRLRDTGDDHLVVDTLIRTESKSFREGGENALAESSVKALRRLLENRGLREEGEEEEEHGD
jgi:hypothetical protein